MNCWILVAILPLLIGCGLRGALPGGTYQPAPYMARAAQGQPAAIAEMREDLGAALLNGTVQKAGENLNRWPNSQFEVIDAMSCWPMTSQVQPAPLVDLATTPSGGPFPRVEINSQRNEPWSVLTIHDQRHAGTIAAMSQWQAQSFKQPYAPTSGGYFNDPASDLANDIMYMARYYYEGHQSYPANPADIFTFCGMGVVERYEREMLRDYDVEFLHDTTIPKVALLLTPKRTGMDAILATCGPDPVLCGNCGNWPQTSITNLAIGQPHGMQPWRAWSYSNIPRVDLSQVVQAAGFSLPSDAPGSSSGSMTGTTGNAAPGSD